MSTELQARVAALSVEQRAKLLQALYQGGKQAPASPTTYPLYDMQRVFWAAQSLDPSSWAYNVGFLFELSAPYRADSLQKAVAALVARHRVLRTVYRVTETGPSQTVLESGSARVEDVDASALDSEALEQQIRAAYERPFDLAKGPVLRLTQFRQSQGDALLLIVGHHLAIDLWSIKIIIDDLRVAYEAERTGEPPRFASPTADYAQFVEEQQRALKGREHERGWAFWSQLFCGVPATLDLPTDRPRPSLPTYRGRSHRFTLSRELTRAVTELAQREGKTLYATLLAVWTLVLHQYGGLNDLVVGTPVSLRSGAFARTVGCAINFLPMRFRVSGDESFLVVLEQVFRTVLDALANQDFPLGALTSRLNLPRSHGRTSLAQVGFCLEGSHLHGHAERDWQPRAVPRPFLAQQEGQFELYLEMADQGGVLHGALRFNSDIFEPETAARLARAFQSLVEQVVAAPSQRVAELVVSGLAPAARRDAGPRPVPTAEEALAIQGLALRALWKRRCENRVSDAPASRIDPTRPSRAETAPITHAEQE